LAPSDDAGPSPEASRGPTLPDGLELRDGLPALVNGEADPCLPLCVHRWAEAGPFTVGERYQTRLFFGGYMTLTPTRPLAGGEDSTGELGLYLAEDLEYGLKFHLDLYPLRDGQRIDGVPRTSAGLLAWLRGHDALVVSNDIPASIGPLPATAVDVRLSPTAPAQFEDCGAPCVDFLGFEQFDHGAIGIRGDDLYRIYFSDIEYGGSTHVLVAHVEARSGAHLDSVIGFVEEILGSVTVPAQAAGSPG
jgi:hypothetical protein